MLKAKDTISIPRIIENEYREWKRRRDNENTLVRCKYCNSFDQCFLSWIHVSCCEWIMNSSETRANKAIGIPQTRWQCISLSQLFWRKRWWSITYHRLFFCLFIRGYSFLCNVLHINAVIKWWRFNICSTFIEHGYAMSSCWHLQDKMMLQLQSNSCNKKLKNLRSLL